jgi:hypothetical protein
MSSWATSSPAASSQPSTDRPLRLWILAAALVVFALNAANFLYFFVDDEGISFVFAQHLLDGAGLQYNSFEGRVEGYTNFLQVVVDAGILETVRALGWPKFDVFFVGKALSLVAGLFVVSMTFFTLRRMRDVETPAAMGALGFLALAGPLAVWSCSSLDAVPFTCLITVLMFALVAGDEAVQAVWPDRLAVAAAVLASLERLDGPLFLAALLAPWLLCARGARRAALLTRVVLPTIACVAVYHGWRVWYFGDWLNMPAYTKVLYKIAPASDILTKAPSESYGRRIADLWGIPVVALAVGAALWASQRSRTIWPTLLASIGALAYVTKVGDWMFGLRLLVPVLPLLAVAFGQTASILFRGHRRLAWAVVPIALLWFGERAMAFEHAYESSQKTVSWLGHPSAQPKAYFGPYYALFEAASAQIPRGARVAYDQAGFLPFMLNLDNVDDLGICSRFYAKLPTRDVFFTEVGRYLGRTRGSALEATDAYLLYRDVQFVIERNDLLRNANDGDIPAELMDGYFAVMETIGNSDTIYRRTERDALEYKRHPSRFTENVAHVAYVRAAALDGRPLSHQEIAPNLPFLRQATGRIGFTSSYSFDVEFADADLNVSELYIADAHATDPVRISLELRRGGDLEYSTTLDVDATGPKQLFVRLPHHAAGNRLHVTLDGPPRRASVWLTDMRVLGQRPVLAAYIRRTLTFQ